MANLSTRKECSAIRRGTVIIELTVKITVTITVLRRKALLCRGTCDEVSPSAPGTLHASAQALLVAAACGSDAYQSALPAGSALTSARLKCAAASVKKLVVVPSCRCCTRAQRTHTHAHVRTHTRAFEY
jgi:hypothetical protein